METDFTINFISTTFIHYHIQLPWQADMDIKISEYHRKEISITDIWDAWLHTYCWIYPHDHPDGSVDWDSQGPQKLPPISCNIFSTHDDTMAIINHDESAAVFSWKGEIIKD